MFTVQATGPNLLGELVYSTVGNSPAPTYFSVNGEGAVTVATNLTRDNTAQYEVLLSELCCSHFSYLSVVKFLSECCVRSIIQARVCWLSS